MTHDEARCDAEDAWVRASSQIPGQLPRHSWQISGFLGTKGKNFVQGCEQNRNHQVEENEMTTLSVDESDRRRVYTYVVETTQ